MRLHRAPGLLLCLVLGCSFDGSGVRFDDDGGGGPGAADAARDDDRDAGATADAAPTDAAPADAAGPCTLTQTDCDEGGADGDWTIDTAEELDTDNDGRCDTVTQTDGPDVCRMHVRSFEITGTGSLRVVGSRPLIVLADGDIRVAGALDAGSNRAGDTGPGANDDACVAGDAAEDDGGGAAGGAGGSFGGAGGAGGEGDTDDSIGQNGTAVGGTAAAAVTQVSVLRGGCPGGAGGDEGNGTPMGKGGAGGASGGAVLLASRGNLTIEIAGSVRATGAGGSGGGEQSGGGGGGSGGRIVLEAASITVHGQLSANGGSGGGGGARISNTPTPGGPGNDGTLRAIGAAGGDGASPLVGEGDGGAGSGGLQSDGASGVSSRVGAGGGGGAAGIITIVGGHSGGGIISPAPTP